MYYMKPLKSPTHIHFLTKIFYRFDTVFALWLWNFPHTLYAYYAERKFCHKYTHALSAVWNRPPIYAYYTREKFRPDIYENRGAAGMMCARLIGVGILAFVCIMFLYMLSSFEEGCFCWLVDVKNHCKNVIKSNKLILKMWLCICNCMCICVCIWRWLWFCCRLDWAVVRL